MQARVLNQPWHLLMKLFSSKQAILIYPAGLAWFEIGYMCGTGCQSAGAGVQCVDSTEVPAAWLQVSLYTPCHCSPHSFAHILQIQRKETHKKRVYFYNSASASTLICSLTKSGSNPFQNTVIRKGSQVERRKEKVHHLQRWCIFNFFTCKLPNNSPAGSEIRFWTALSSCQRRCQKPVWRPRKM